MLTDHILCHNFSIVSQLTLALPEILWIDPSLLSSSLSPQKLSLIPSSIFHSLYMPHMPHISQSASHLQPLRPLHSKFSTPHFLLHQ